jgi:hypothetical protein
MRLSSARGAEPHGGRNGIEACGGADGSPPKCGLDDVDERKRLDRDRPVHAGAGARDQLRGAAALPPKQARAYGASRRRCSSLAGVCRYACSLPLSMRKKQCGSRGRSRPAAALGVIPGLPHPVRGGARAARRGRSAPALRRSPRPPDRVLRRALLRAGRAAAALNWYRTMRRPAKRGPITSPTLYVWSMAMPASARRRRATSSAML